MKKFAFEDIEKEELGKGCKGVSIRWLITKDMGAENFAMRLFEVEPEGNTPLHSHEWEHEIIIHAGKGEVFCEGEWVPVTRGYTVFIPGNEEHQIRNAGDELLVFACVIPAGPPEL